MSQLADIHEAVADKLRAKVRREVNVADHPFSRMKLPKLEVWPADDYFDPYADSDSDSGLLAVNLRIVVTAATADPGTAFKVMTDLLGWEAGSIRAALMETDADGHRTLAGVVDDVVVSGVVQWDASEDLSAQSGSVPVTVYVQKETT